MLKLVSFSQLNFEKLFIICHATDVNIQSPQFVDPKMQYSEYHRPSRPYLDHQAKSEIDSLASELQDAKNHLG